VEKHETRVGRLAAFFRERPGCWIDGRTLGAIGGSCAWRTRAPFLMTIENRQRTIQTQDGAVTISEYRYVPPTVAQAVSLSATVVGEHAE
jgi:hypothetical protein